MSAQSLGAHFFCVHLPFPNNVTNPHRNGLKKDAEALPKKNGQKIETLEDYPQPNRQVLMQMSLFH